MKKICIISTRFDPDLGGSEVLSKTLANFFYENKYILEVITTRSLLPRQHNNYKFKIHELDFNNFMYFNEIIKNNNYEACLFICDLNSPFLNFYDLSCKNNFCILNLDERTYMVKDQYYNSCKNLKSFNKVFTFTKNSVANKFLENNNIKNCYIQNFSRDILKTNVDENYKTKIKLLFEKDSKLILYPGAYEERKNQKYLLQLLNGSSSLREFNWLFVGAVSDKSYLDDCMSFSIKNKLNAKFLKASIDTSYIDKLYQVCDLVFLGSIAEGMPLVLIEALSANIPWVSTDVGGVKGVLGESNTGSIIKINYTQNDAYNAIKLGLNNNIIVNRRKFWEQNFNVDDVLKIYENKIQEAINDNF